MEHFSKVESQSQSSTLLKEEEEEEKDEGDAKSTDVKLRATPIEQNKIQIYKVNSLKQRYRELGDLDAEILKRITQKLLNTAILHLTKPKNKK